MFSTLRRTAHAISRARVYTCAHAHTHTHTCTHAYTHTHMQTHTGTCTACACTRARACIHVCTYMCAYICTYTCAQAQALSRMQVCAHVHACTRACVHIHTMHICSQTAHTPDTAQEDSQCMIAMAVDQNCKAHQTIGPCQLAECIWLEGYCYSDMAAGAAQQLSTYICYRWEPRHDVHACMLGYCSRSSVL